jgi:hypothetical protein
MPTLLLLGTLPRLRRRADREKDPGLLAYTDTQYPVVEGLLRSMDWVRFWEVATNTKSAMDRGRNCRRIHTHTAQNTPQQQQQQRTTSYDTRDSPSDSNASRHTGGTGGRQRA